MPGDLHKMNANANQRKVGRAIQFFIQDGWRRWRHPHQLQTRWRGDRASSHLRLYEKCNRARKCKEADGSFTTLWATTALVTVLKYGHIPRRPKQPPRRRQQESHRFAYSFFISVHFVTVLVLWIKVMEWPELLDARLALASVNYQTTTETSRF